MPADFISNHLIEGGGMQVGALFGLDEFRNHLVRAITQASRNPGERIFEKVLK